MSRIKIDKRTSLEEAVELARDAGGSTQTVELATAWALISIAKSLLDVVDRLEHIGDNLAAYVDRTTGV